MAITKSQRRSYARNALLGTAAVVLLALAVWIMLYQNQARKVVDWLLDRPIPVAVPGLERTSAWKTDQEAFHAMEAALYGAFMNLQVTPDQIRDTAPRTATATGRWRPLERRIIVSGTYSLTECNLEIARAVVRAGGKVSRAEERTRSGELMLDITFDDDVTHRLNITRDPAIQRKTGRLAVVIAYTDGDQRAVVEGLSDFTRPLTFALFPWADGVNEMAAELTRGDHEVMALLPVQPASDAAGLPRRRSVSPTHSELTNRRVVEDALATLPGAQGVLRYPAGRTENEAEVLAPVLDELAKRNLYYLDNPGGAGGPGASAGSANAGGPGGPGGGGPEDRDGESGRLRAWGVLDPLYNPVIISMNLDRASLSALDDTRAVVIADARLHTLQVLMDRMRYLEIRGIEFVRVSDLVDN
ncbi:MAG: divergent polysaccharide deacetylase family protein [Gemmatimonadetes bacterium]|nr:divergent polysaccharide deacetylase family protein [Gemmatimonadota bacterium]